MDLFIAMAVYQSVHPKTVHSLMRLTTKLRAWQFDSVQKCNIPPARNELVVHFLESKAPFMLSVDADMKFTPEDVERLHESIQQPFVGLVGGNYCKRDGSNIPLCSPLPEMSKDDLLAWTKKNAGKAVQAHAIPTGLMMIRREVFVAIEPPWFEFVYPQRGSLNGISSDVNFCRKVRGAGFLTMAHLGVRANHIGDCEYSLED